jgi:hypothetical protein
MPANGRWDLTRHLKGSILLEKARDHAIHCTQLTHVCLSTIIYSMCTPTIQYGMTLGIGPSVKISLLSSTVPELPKTNEKPGRATLHEFDERYDFTLQVFC